MAVRIIRKSWWVDFRIDHTRYRKRSPENSRVGALAYEAALRQRVARGEDILGRQQRGEDQTFAEFSKKWFEEYLHWLTTSQLHSALTQSVAAFSKDAEDNQVTQKTKLTMPVLAIGAEKSFGTVMATAMRNVAVDVTGAVVPDAGHWIMEENPAPAVKLIGDFLK